MEKLRTVYFNKRVLRLFLTGVIVVSFFLPWFTVESTTMVIAKRFSEQRSVVVDSISGYDIPRLANSDESRFMISLIKIFDPGTGQAGKSYGVWFFPFFAVAIFYLTFYFNGNKWVHLAIGAAGCLIFLGSVWKIAAADLDQMIMPVKAAYGLWILLSGYLILGALSLADFLAMNKDQMPEETKFFEKLMKGEQQHEKQTGEDIQD